MLRWSEARMVEPRRKYRSMEQWKAELETKVYKTLRKPNYPSLMTFALAFQFQVYLTMG